MPNDFRGRPIPQAGFGGVGYSEVLAFEVERMLEIGWYAAPEDASTLDTTVTFTLEPEGTGTRLFLVHDDIEPQPV